MARFAGCRSCLGRTMHSLAQRVWRDLGDGAKYGVLPKEETLTESTLIKLKRLKPDRVGVRMYSTREEGEDTGADWEWWFTDTRDYFGFRVQAKKLDVRNAANSYPELGKVGKNSRKRQVDMLIESAEGARPVRRFPIYSFYNSWDGDPSRSATPCGIPMAVNRLSYGWTVAGARRVRGAIDRKKTRLVDILPISQPVGCLFCCRNGPRKAMGLPHRARKAACHMTTLSRFVPPVTQQPPWYVAALFHQIAPNAHQPKCVDGMGEDIVGHLRKEELKGVVLFAGVPPE